MKNSDIVEFIRDAIVVWFNNKGGEKNHNPLCYNNDTIKGSLYVDRNYLYIEIHKNNDRKVYKYKKKKELYRALNDVKKQGCKFYVR